MRFQCTCLPGAGNPAATNYGDAPPISKKGRLAMPTRTKAAPSNQQGSHRDKGLLKSQAYDRLKTSIVTGAYPPGSFLSERRLVEELGMSKTPIRAALERLEGEDYVRISPRQGIVVREPSVREIADQFEIRLALERHVLKSLAGKLATA